MVDVKFTVLYNPGFKGLLCAIEKREKSRLKGWALPEVIPCFFVSITKEAIPIVVIEIRTSSRL